MVLWWRHLDAFFYTGMKEGPAKCWFINICETLCLKDLLFNFLQRLTWKFILDTQKGFNLKNLSIWWLSWLCSECLEDFLRTSTTAFFSSNLGAQVVLAVRNGPMVKGETCIQEIDSQHPRSFLIWFGCGVSFILARSLRNRRSTLCLLTLCLLTPYAVQRSPLPLCKV